MIVSNSVMAHYQAISNQEDNKTETLQLKGK